MSGGERSRSSLRPVARSLASIGALLAIALAPTVARAACGEGMLELGPGRCCWPGQGWSLSRHQCTGAPICPAGFDAAGGGCVAKPLPKVICPTGQVQNLDTEGRCCWPQQVWSRSRLKCIGTPACPSGFETKGDTCEAKVAACEGGRVKSDDTAGHCCWPGQVWAYSRGECIGAPSCPEGMAVHGASCEPRAHAAAQHTTPPAAPATQHSSAPPPAEPSRVTAATQHPSAPPPAASQQAPPAASPSPSPAAPHPGAPPPAGTQQASAPPPAASHQSAAAPASHAASAPPPGSVAASAPPPASHAASAAPAASHAPGAQTSATPATAPPPAATPAREPASAPPHAVAASQHAPAAEQHAAARPGEPIRLVPQPLAVPPPAEPALSASTPAPTTPAPATPAPTETPPAPAAPPIPPPAEAPTAPAAGPPAKVPVRFLPRDPDHDYTVEIGEEHCVAPCTVEVPPGSQHVRISGDGSFVTDLAVPPHPTFVRLRHRANGRIVGGAILAALGIGGLSWGGWEAANYLTPLGLGIAASAIAVGAVELGVGAVLIGTSGRNEAQLSDEPPPASAAGLHLAGAAVAPSPGGASASVSFTF